MAKFNKHYVLVNIIEGVSEFSQEDIRNKSVLIRSMADFLIFISNTKGVEMLSQMVDPTYFNTLQVDQSTIDCIHAKAFRKQWMISETVDFIFTDWISYSGMHELNLPKEVK